MQFFTSQTPLCEYCSTTVQTSHGRRSPGHRTLASMTLTKAILTTELTNKLGLSKPEAQAVVEAFFEEMSGALVSGDDIKLANFGVFSVRQKAERQGRNPKTGEDKVITARRVVSFHPSEKLRVAADATEPRGATEPTIVHSTYASDD